MHAAVVLKSPSRYIDYRASSQLFVPFFSSINAEGYRGKKLYTARKLVEDGREFRCAIGSSTRPHGPRATCAPIRRVNLPTCFASRRIISRARDIDFSIPLYRPSTHHRLIGISYAASVPTVTGYCCPVVYSPSSCL